MRSRLRWAIYYIVCWTNGSMVGRRDVGADCANPEVKRVQSRTSRD